MVVSYESDCTDGLRGNALGGFALLGGRVRCEGPWYSKVDVRVGHLEWQGFGTSGKTLVRGMDVGVLIVLPFSFATSKGPCSGYGAPSSFTSSWCSWFDCLYRKNIDRVLVSRLGSTISACPLSY